MDQSLIQFFHDYRAARSANDHEQLHVADRLIKQFHTESCSSEDTWLQARRKEEVSATMIHGHRAEIHTEGDLPGPKRYLVIRVSDLWRIEKIQKRCDFCEGTGHDDLLTPSKTVCSYCAGSGWLEWND